MRYLDADVLVRCIPAYDASKQANHFSLAEYAAAFFLLADRVKDAANVLATQLKDIQLAVAVTRVYEGDDGPVLKQLLQDKVLPVAAQQGDRWLAHWAFDMIGRRDLAMRCLAVSGPRY